MNSPSPQMTTKPPCRYCGKPIEQAHTREIISRDNSSPSGLLRRRLAFCSEDCGAYYQMGCEG